MTDVRYHGIISAITHATTRLERGQAMSIEGYVLQRRKAVKAAMRRLREEAGISQEEVARLLGCARTRITAIENMGSTAEYSLGEIELLAGILGKYPLDLVRMSGPNAIALGNLLTSTQTGSALRHVVDCKLPKRIEKLYANNADRFPSGVVFSPSGNIMASIVDEFVEEEWWDWQEEPAPKLTVLCWDTSSGDLIGQKRIEHVEYLAVLEHLVVLATAQPSRKIEDAREFEGTYTLQIWNPYTNEIAAHIDLPDRAGALAVSPDGMYLAAYMPTTTTIQVWLTADWSPVHAFELEPFGSDPTSIGAWVRQASETARLPRTRKWNRIMSDYRASRFEFMNSQLLVFAYGDRTIELSLNASRTGPESQIEYTRSFSRQTHLRTDEWEIAVNVACDFDFGESQIEFAYLIPRAGLHPFNTQVYPVKRCLGKVHQPVIIDEGCVLAWVSYDTAFPSGMIQKTRLGLCNLVTGQVVMLSDAGHLQERDDQINATLSPTGTMIAYWVYPDGGVPRLAIQYVDYAPLQRQGVSLDMELILWQEQMAKKFGIRQSHAV